jgi:hypothetical protein
MATNANTLPRLRTNSAGNETPTSNVLRLAIRRLRRERAAGDWQTQIEIGRETGVRC